MNWLIALLVGILTPVVQPVIQTGVEQLRDRVQVRVQQLQQPQQQAYVVYHEGRWWRCEQGQWYMWTGNDEMNPATAGVPVYWNDGQRWWCQMGNQRYAWNGNTGTR